MTKPVFLRPLLVLFVVLGISVTARAQQHIHIRTTASGGHWDFPLTVDSIQDITVSDDLKQLLFNVTESSVVPFVISQIDSLTIEEAPAEETKDPYRVFQLYITTDDGQDITSRENYKDCFIVLNAQGSFSNYSANAQIRGRGNSTFLWYDKKPFRLKLNEKHKMLGLAKAKSWVLLANYRDVTDMMNTYVFETGRWLGLPYTNHTRYVELFVNGDYRGIYQLTEQVQQNKNRVDVSDERGILLALDVDDGPGLSPEADDNFKTRVYRMPAAIKYPDDEHFTANTVDSVRTVFAELEQAIKDQDYAHVEQLLDIPSFIKYLQIQEFVYNVELSAPRSIFLHKDGDGKWVMGPLWDFDAGYDFDWKDMTTGHTFFSDYRETVMGSNPLKRNGNYKDVPQFFTDLFGCPEFVEAYKAQWAAVSDSIVSHGWDECMKYIDNLKLSGAVEREAKRWPISRKTFDTEVEKMHQWLLQRADFMTDLIANIPMPDTTTVTGGQLCGTLTTNVVMDWNDGYHQKNQIHVSKSDVLGLMGLTEEEFSEPKVQIIPMNTDGTEGWNGTNGVFGGWFDGDGDPGAFAQGHVYIEVFSDLWNWSCGLQQWVCWDNEHTVTMQYQYPHEGTLKKVNIEVHFTITNNW